MSHIKIADRTMGLVTLVQLVAFLYADGKLTNDQVSAVARAIELEEAEYRFGRVQGSSSDPYTLPTEGCDTKQS
jgi:hypothetical protein